MYSALVVHYIFSEGDIAVSTYENISILEKNKAAAEN
jgi:hypothetical protein